MNMTDIQVIEQQGVRVLTTAQLAECYGTDSRIIANNFNRNKERYEEGKHYICLKGAELQEFKTIHQFDEQFKHSAKVYLWTERGALLHAKSLNTDKAWEVYDQLVETYFRAKKAQIALQNLSPQTQAMINLEVRQNELENRVNDLERRFKSAPAHAHEPVPEPAKPEPKPWSERELDYLRKAYALGQTDTEIAADLGRTISSISNKRRVLGLHGKTCQHWTPAEDKKLIKLHKQGVTYLDIGKLIGKSYDSIHNRLYRLRKAGKL